MPEERIIYSSGREAYYNLNSTWYGPAGSWLDTRRKPFRYVVNTSCVCCNRRDDIPRRGGHDYRCYGYRRSTCQSGCNPRVTTCVHNPSGGPRDYWGRPIGDSCNGCTGGHYSNEESFCGAGCGGGGNACSQPSGSSGGCGGGGGVCSEPVVVMSRGCSGRGGVCSEPACARSSRRLQTSGGSICCSTSGGCGGGGGVCSEPVVVMSRGCSGRGGGVCSEPVAMMAGGCGGGGGGVCSEPVAMMSGGCGGGGVCCDPVVRGPRSLGRRLWGEPGCNRGC